MQNILFCYNDSMKNNAINIDGRMVGDGCPVYIIAEAGSNHNRDYDTALRLIDVAADSGADAVKFQTYSAETLYSKKTPTMTYIKKDGLLKDGESIWDLIKRIEMPREWHEGLAAHCRSRGITFLSTPFDLKAVEELEAVNVAAYKIASFEIVHYPLLRAVGRTGKPVILSSGMADLEDIDLAIKTIRGVGDSDIALMHCAIGYPPKDEDVNLRAMDTMRDAFGLPVGFSDHTMGHRTDAAAVARGACVIEKHFTLSRSQDGPDHPFSLEPDELKSMVQAVRDTEKLLGSSVKKHTESESELYSLARRSLVAAKDISAGSILSEDMIEVKRPGFGVSPKDIEKLIGKKAARNIEEDDILLWEMFE